MHKTKNIFSGFKSLVTVDVTHQGLLIRLLEELLEMEVSTPDGVQAFLERRDELEKHFETERHESYFLMTADVADEARKNRHERVERELAPLMEAYRDKLNRKLLSCPELKDMPAPFDIVRRNLRSDVERFRPENVDLQKQIDLLCIEITELQGKLTASWEGREIPIPEIYPLIQSLDREVRKMAYEATLAANESISVTLDDKFTQLVQLRHKMAINAGFDNFTPYRFKEMKRFDWGPPECYDFHHAVKKHLFPLRDKLQELRRTGLGIQEVRPFDTACDIKGREPLKIYEKGESARLVEGTGNIIAAMDPGLFGYFRKIRDNSLLDLDVRKNKADAAYMASYPVYEQASVFYSGTGLGQDLLVLLHELGHCFHYFLSKDIFPYSMLDWTAEVAEVGSMSIELMGLEELEQYLDPDKARRLKEDRLRQIIGFFIMMARGDEFQHWIYANPDHSSRERREKWIELAQVYSPGVNRDGYEDAMSRTGWQFLHILQIPFYLIDYAISELVALTLWDRYKDDPKDAISRYKKGCSLKGSRPVPEIFEAFGTTFSFGVEKIEPLAKRLVVELKL